MLSILKYLGRRNPALGDLYRRAIFTKELFFHDLFDFTKIRLFLRVFPAYAMNEYARLSNAYELAREMEEQKKEGAFVECGVWKGGSIGVMAYAAHQANSGRKIWLFDSFEGLPEPTRHDGKMAEEYASQKASGKLEPIAKCVAPLEDVERLFFSILRFRRENIVIQKGWFQDTIPFIKDQIGAIAILRIDADWYESTRFVLEHLYDHVISGGYIILDDYGYWEGCRKAVHEFFQSRNLHIPISIIDYTGAYFQKP